MEKRALPEHKAFKHFVSSEHSEVLFNSSPYQSRPVLATNTYDFPPTKILYLLEPADKNDDDFPRNNWKFGTEVSDNSN